MHLGRPHMSDEKTKVIINCLNAGMKVVETAMVSKTRTAGGMFLTIEGNETTVDRQGSAGHRRDRGLAP